jgi:hypothetical protein
MGPFGAAFTVVFWGTTHALLQIPATAFFFKYPDCQLQRIPILIIGSVLPVIALAASTFLLGTTVNGVDGGGIGLLPALYWQGMDYGFHWGIFILACFTGSYFILPVICYAITDRESLLSDRQVAIIDAVLGGSKRVDMLVITLARNLVISIGISIPLSMILAIVTFNPLWLFGNPLMIIHSVLVIPCSIVIYIFQAYFHLGSNASESCFFMPCAPQSISEEDQKYALFVGLFAFLGYEGFPLVSKELKGWYREIRLFVQRMEGQLGQFEVRRRTTPELNP